jgi:hypothetical protein
MSRTKECSCNQGMTNSNTKEFVINDSMIELRRRKCNGVVRWWNEDDKKITPSRRVWSEEECSSMR